MAIEELDWIIDKAGDVVDTVNEIVGRFTKALQVLVDSEAEDPEADNEHNVIVIPKQYYSRFYFTLYTDWITEGYNDYAHGYAYQYWGFCADMTLNNGILTLNNSQYIGRCTGTPDRWGYLSQAEIDDIEGKAKAGTVSFEVINNYPDSPIVNSYNNNCNYSFKPQGHNQTDLSVKTTYINQEKSPETRNRITNQINLTNITYDSDTDIIDGVSVLGNTVFSPFKRPFMLVTDSITSATDYVSNNDAEHNYSIQYTATGGDMTLYYGDNYMIYYIPSSVTMSYDDIYNITKTAANKINSDNPTKPPIKVPTYNENKYGPPEPEPITDDDYVDMGLGVETDGMAMYNMAVITRDDLIQLITDFEANADTGLSFIPHVLGLYKLGIESSQLLTTNSEQIKLHKEPNGTSAFTSVDSYNIVKDQLTVIDCGSITIDREELLTNTFYDYSPYSTYEMFIPGCGWITLPDTVVGRTISVSIVFDLTTCSCKGVVRSEGQLLGGSGTTLATVNGIIGSSVPLSINETGLQRAAIFNGSTQAAMALGTAFLGAGLGNPYMGASGLAMAAGALADNHVAGNTTYTNTKGGATDYSVFGDGYKAVLKITRPVVEIPDNYGHTVGFVVNEYGMLSDFHGFTVCVNPHIHISATSDEKEEIKRLLESGVILPDGE